MHLALLSRIYLLLVISGENASSQLQSAEARVDVEDYCEYMRLINLLVLRPTLV